MNTHKSVLGVLCACRVAFWHSTQVETLKFAALRGLCGVCWVWRRARACVMFFHPQNERAINSYARDVKPNQPNTLNSEAFICMNLKGFICVGSVLACWFSVSGSVFGGTGDDR